MVAIRKCRERAWHARLMINTTAISCIESISANFKEDIENEEFATFKAYLQLATTNIAVVENLPTPQKSHHTLDRLKAVAMDQEELKMQEKKFV